MFHLSSAALNEKFPCANEVEALNFLETLKPYQNYRCEVTMKSRSLKNFGTKIQTRNFSGCSGSCLNIFGYTRKFFGKYLETYGQKFSGRVLTVKARDLLLSHTKLKNFRVYLKSSGYFAAVQNFE